MLYYEHNLNYKWNEFIIINCKLELRLVIIKKAKENCGEIIIYLVIFEALSIRTKNVGGDKYKVLELFEAKHK